MFDLSGKVALVTGGSRGIGRAAVIALAERGAHVVINYVSNEGAAREVAETVERAAVTKASATSATKVKSRVCVPSPTIVNGLPASFCATNTPNTAP